MEVLWREIAQASNVAGVAAAKGAEEAGGDEDDENEEEGFDGAVEERFRVDSVGA